MRKAIEIEVDIALTKQLAGVTPDMEPKESDWIMAWNRAPDLFRHWVKLNRERDEALADAANRRTRLAGHASALA